MNVDPDEVVRKMADGPVQIFYIEMTDLFMERVAKQRGCDLIKRAKDQVMERMSRSIPQRDCSVQFKWTEELVDENDEVVPENRKLLATKRKFTLVATVSP